MGTQVIKEIEDIEEIIKNSVTKKSRKKKTTLKKMGKMKTKSRCM